MTHTERKWKNQCNLNTKSHSHKEIKSIIMAPIDILKKIDNEIEYNLILFFSTSVCNE